MTINVHHVGDLVRITGTFKNIDGTLTDPTTITLTVQDPAGNQDAYTFAGGTVTRDSTGVYYKDVSIDEAGEWHYFWESTGAAQGAEPGQFVVEPTAF